MNDTVIATPNPTPTAVTGATGISVLIGWLASLAASKWHVPVEVIGAGIAGLSTVLTSVWHHFFGPGVPVQKP